MKSSAERALIAKQNRDLTSGNLLKKIIIYTIPLFLGSALSLLFTTVDLVTVAQFGGGNNSSAAVGATNSLINIILALFWGLTAGAGVVIANAKGAHDVPKVTRSIGTTILLTFFVGIGVMILGTIFSKVMLQWLQTPENLLDLSTQYLTIYFIGAPFNLLYNAGAGILRALGDTKRPFYAILIGGVVNIGLDLLMVFPPFSMDVKGVAIATVASQAVCMVIVFLYLMKDKRLSANFSFKYLKIYKEECRDILRIGIASALQSLIFNITNVLIQASTNALSVEAVIGKSAASSIEGYQYALLNSISSCCSVAVAQNYGAKDKKRIKNSLYYSIYIELIAVTVFDLIIIALHGPLLSIFINQGEPTTEEATRLAFNSMLIMGIPYALCGIAECFTSYLRGLKYSIVPTTVSLICIVGIRIVYIFTLFTFVPFFHTFEALIWIYPVSWLACCLVYIPVCIHFSKKSFKKLDEEVTLATV